jgi:glycerate kinase
MRILTEYFGGKFVKAKVPGPLFDYVDAEYGTDNDDGAFIEMASASGLELLPIEKRNPLDTTSFGTGQLILHAAQRGAKRIILGIGGSSTNDAGIGMAEALGYKFLDLGKKPLKPIGRNLVNIESIDKMKVTPLIRSLRVTALCDVNNPLYGPNGAAYIYGPQKGADAAAVSLLDQGLMNFERVAKRTFGKSADFPGAGAGGGIAGGANVFFNLNVRSGIEFIMGTLRVKEQIESADLIITGEGKIDRQTLAGKVVGTVAKYASDARKKTIAVCGICELRKNEVEKIGISDVISLTDPFTTPENAIANARQLLIDRVASAIQ